MAGWVYNSHGQTSKLLSSGCCFVCWPNNCSSCHHPINLIATVSIVILESNVMYCEVIGLAPMAICVRAMVHCSQDLRQSLGPTNQPLAAYRTQVPNDSEGSKPHALSCDSNLGHSYASSSNLLLHYYRLLATWFWFDTAALLFLRV